MKNFKNIDLNTLKSLSSILPDEPLLMMGAGPVPIPAKVSYANSIVINHLGETMSEVISQVKKMSKYVFQTSSEYIYGVAGPGSAAMEMAICNVIDKSAVVLSVCNGFFSNRFALMAERNGATVIRIDVDHNILDINLLESYLIKYKPQFLTITHGETSNCYFQKNLPQITKTASNYGCYVIVDAICTLSTTNFEMDSWGVDVVVTGGQKGLSSIPGVSLLAFSQKIWEQIIKPRTFTPNQWTLDALLAEKFWSGGGYHYTAPVSGILALHEALWLVCSETLEKRFIRHEKCSKALQKGIEGMGLELYGNSDNRLNSVIGINIPNGIGNVDVCKHISRKYKVEISGAFGLNIVRIGQMGEQCRVTNLFRTLHAIGSTFLDFEEDIDLPAGMAILEKNIVEFYEPK